MGGFRNCTLAVFVLASLICVACQVSGLIYATENDECSETVARKSVPYCYSALYDVNMKARESSQSTRHTCCCSLHGLERCLRSTFSYLGCSSEKLIEEEFVNLVSEAMKNGDMVLDGPCEDYEDDTICRAEVSAFDNAALTFTKVVPRRPELSSETPRSSNRQPRIELLNTSSSSQTNLHDRIISQTSNSEEVGKKSSPGNCSSGSNVSHEGCSKLRTDSERTQRAYLEWESSKQLVVVVTDENGDKIVLTINRKGSGVLVNTLLTEPNEGNDHFEWSHITKVLGVLPTEKNSSTILVSSNREDGSMFYDGKDWNRNEVIPNELISFMRHYMNSSNISVHSFGEEDMPYQELNPYVSTHIQEHFAPAVNRTPKFFNWSTAETEFRYNLTQFMKSVNESWQNLLHSFSSVGGNETRNLKSLPEASLHKLFENTNSSQPSKSEAKFPHISISRSLDVNETSVPQREEHSRGLFNEATLQPFPEEPSMSNITDPQEFQVLFFGLWPDDSSTTASGGFPNIRLGNTTTLITPNSSILNLFRGARLSDQKPQEPSPCTVGNFSGNVTTRRDSNCTKETGIGTRIPKSYGHTLNASNTDLIDNTGHKKGSTNSSNTVNNSSFHATQSDNLSSPDALNATSTKGEMWHGSNSSSEHYQQHIVIKKGNSSRNQSAEEIRPGHKLPSAKNVTRASSNTTERKHRSEGLGDISGNKSIIHKDNMKISEGVRNVSTNGAFSGITDTRGVGTLYTKNSSLNSNTTFGDRNKSNSNLTSQYKKVNETTGNSDTSRPGDNFSSNVTGKREDRSDWFNLTVPHHRLPKNKTDSMNQSYPDVTAQKSSMETLKPVRSRSLEDSIGNSNETVYSNHSANGTETRDVNLIHNVSRRETTWSRASRLTRSLFTLGEMDINLS